MEQLSPTELKEKENRPRETDGGESKRAKARKRGERWCFRWPSGDGGARRARLGSNATGSARFVKVDYKVSNLEDKPGPPLSVLLDGSPRNHECAASRPHEKRARTGFGNWHPSSAFRSFCVSRASTCWVLSSINHPPSIPPVDCNRFHDWCYLCVSRAPASDPLRSCRFAAVWCWSNRSADQHHGQLSATRRFNRLKVEYRQNPSVIAIKYDILETFSVYYSIWDNIYRGSVTLHDTGSDPEDAKIRYTFFLRLTDATFKTI